jgi:hypothetical protein
MATVTGTIKLADGTPYEGDFTLYPLTTPVVSGGSVVAGNSPITVTTEDDGTFSVELELGYYRVEVLGTTWWIGVPSGSSMYDIADLTAASLRNAIVPDPGGTATPTVATPVISPASGSFSTSRTVTITCATAGSTIYYTTNGDTPTEDSTEYTGSITVTETTTVKAIAVAEGYDDSAVATATYTKLTLYPIYWGISESESLDEAGILGLDSIEASTKNGNYEFDLPESPEQYLYFAWPNSLGSPTAVTGFSAFGFPMGMASGGVFDQVGNGWYYDEVSVGGVTYRLYRTEYKQGVDYTVTVS